MGCFNSKTKQLEFVIPPGEEGSSPTGTGSGPSAHTGTEGRNEGLGRLLPASKVPPTMEDARSDGEMRLPRLSVKYQSKEISGRGSANSRRSSTPFDRARIGTHTRHGLMPGPRGFSAAKINQDRGVVCWPFNGSYNQALLCVFDGHGSKGERASEFCMKTVPELLEKESSKLKAAPPAAISKARAPPTHQTRVSPALLPRSHRPGRALSTSWQAVIKTDELLLSSPELGRLAMTCGTTSTVVYFHGTDCYTACSGDSRAVKGVRRNGSIHAVDLSIDHKPDLPEEKKRILANGGTVSDGTAGRPARVWAHGRIGLAMSRSIGDGECKHVGVIPDPDVRHSAISPPAKDGADGDLFIIVASDGVWEFIPSDEACRLVDKHKNATEACSALVLEAALRWKRFEGSYRDDITAIVAHLPFLEAWGEEVTEEGEEEEPESTSKVFLNMGSQGERGATKGTAVVSRQTRPAQLIPLPCAACVTGISFKEDELARTEEEGAEEEGDAAASDESKEFAARRLSVHNPYDEDWNELGDGDDSAPEDGSGSGSTSTQRA